MKRGNERVGAVNLVDLILLINLMASEPFFVNDTAIEK